MTIVTITITAMTNGSNDDSPLFGKLSSAPVWRLERPWGPELRRFAVSVTMKCQSSWNNALIRFTSYINYCSIWQYMYMLYQVISILIYQLWIINYPHVSLIIPMFWSDFVSWPISTLKKKYDKIGVTPRGFATFFTPVATLGAGPGIDPRSQRPGLRWLHGLISLV